MLVMVLFVFLENTLALPRVGFGKFFNVFWMCICAVMCTQMCLYSISNFKQ